MAVAKRQTKKEKSLKKKKKRNKGKIHGLISFRINRFDLLAVQGTPKSLLQKHS